jgi:hypothetical protein
MKVTKPILLKCGRSALEARGYVTKLIRGQRITPGSRLEATKESQSHLVAVRTTRHRELGLLREPSRRWRTVSSVEEVIVVARSLEEEMAVDVMSFDAELLCQIFDAVVRDRAKDAHTYPVFVPLDDTGRNGNDVIPGLSKRATWQSTLWISEDTGQPIATPASAAGFVERVKREFAKMMGVDVSTVTVEFRINT